MSGVVNVEKERGDLRSWLTKSFGQNFMKKFFEGALLKNLYKNREIRDYIEYRGSGAKRKIGFFLRGGGLWNAFCPFWFQISFRSCL